MLLPQRFSYLRIFPQTFQRKRNSLDSLPANKISGNPLREFWTLPLGKGKVVQCFQHRDALMSFCPFRHGPRPLAVGNAKPRREYAAFSLFHPIQGWNKATAHGRGRFTAASFSFLAWARSDLVGRVERRPRKLQNSFDSSILYCIFES